VTSFGNDPKIVRFEPKPRPKSQSSGLPDSVGWSLLNVVPAAAVPYVQLARIDRPVGWWLLLLPCWWSSTLATALQNAPPNVFHLILFLIGAIAMRGAGSTYNDIIDREVDAKVFRTKNRPLPSGRVSVRNAKLFLLAQCVVGLAVVVQFNRFAIVLAFGSLIFVAIYPFMKRVTSWPQAILGLAFSWGGLMGWAATYGSLDTPAYLLYAAAIVWTIGYDTIYALQDIADDSIAGIKSTARLFGDNVRLAVAFLYAGAFALVYTALVVALAGPLARAGAIGFGLHLFWQVKTMDPSDPKHALKLFRSNRDAGLILFLGLVAEGVRRAYFLP